MPELQLVTGAAGFIGRALVRRLAAAGLPVRCLVRPGKPPPPDLPAAAEILRGDLLDPAVREAAVRGAARVWHLAALVRPGGRLARLSRLLGEFRAVNEEAPALLAAAAARAGVRRFVHFSTISAIGPGLNLRDDAAPAPLTLYGKSKLAGELRLREAAGKAGLDQVTLRPAMVYGPGSPGWAPLFASVRAGSLLGPGDGSNLFSVCYVENFLDAALLAADKAAPGAALNVSEGSISLRGIAETVAAAYGSPLRFSGLPPAALKRVSWLIFHALGGAGLYLPGFLGGDPARIAEVCASWSHECEGLKALGWRPAVATARGLAVSAEAAR